MKAVHLCAKVRNSNKPRISCFHVHLDHLGLGWKTTREGDNFPFVLIHAFAFRAPCLLVSLMCIIFFEERGTGLLERQFSLSGPVSATLGEPHLSQQTQRRGSLCRKRVQCALLLRRRRRREKIANDAAAIVTIRSANKAVK